MIRIRQIKIDIDKNSLDEIRRKISKKLKVKLLDIEEFYVTKKSIDVRDKNKIIYVYEVVANIKGQKEILKRSKSKDISIYKEKEYKIPESGNSDLNYRPIIIGSSFSGLFSSYILAKAGYRPIIVEEGSKIAKRVDEVTKFWNSKGLNKKANVIIGEGGKEIFSNGIINNRAFDFYGRKDKVLKVLLECGAPGEIMFDQNAYIGYDLWASIIEKLREKIINLGGTFLFKSDLNDVKIIDNKIDEITIDAFNKIKTDILILAIDSNSSNIIEMLLKKGIKMKYKNFAIGVRIEHPQIMIDMAMYGHNHNSLPKTGYEITYKALNTRNVYTTNMCPGGYVVNSSIEDSYLNIGGILGSKQDSGNANSSILVEVDPEDYGYNPLDGITYQKRIENLAFRKGQGKIPIQLLGDYLDNRTSTSFGMIKPKIKGDYLFSNLNEIFPFYINEALKEGIKAFDKKINGFARRDAILSAVETRGSSVLEILRDESLESNINGIYPTGAFYHEDIMSLAIDGMKVAEEIIKKYRKL